MPEGGLKTLLARATAPELLTQLLLLAAIVLASLAVGSYARAWFRRGGFAARSGWQPPVIEGAVALSGVFTALVLLLVTRGLMHGAPVALIELGLQLGTVLLLVRFLVYCAAALMGRESWVHRWDTRLTIGLWVLISFSVLGWFGFFEDALDAIDLIPGKGRFTIWALLKGLVVVTLFVMIGSVVSRALEQRVMRIEALAMSTRIGITKFSYFFLISLGVLVGINAAGVDLTALTVLTGAVGIGLGFGLQSIASNFVSGFVLLMDKSIKPGDVISFTGTTGTSTENFGWVQELRGRYVVVRDRDGVETLVPNQNLITTPVINWGYSDRKVRLKLPVRVSYHDDPEKALEVLVEAAHCSPRVLRDPAPVSRLMHFSDHGIDLELRFWIADPEGGVNNVRSDVNRSIWQAFKQQGITIPTAQREIRMVTTRGGGS
ncbi:MAG: mechanosensitive ion channel domain-containing protein [Steroidobacteraceae bacterium]